MSTALEEPPDEARVPAVEDPEDAGCGGCATTAYARESHPLLREAEE